MTGVNVRYSAWGYEVSSVVNGCSVGIEALERLKLCWGKDRFPKTREDDSTGISIDAAEG